MSAQKTVLKHAGEADSSEALRTDAEKAASLVDVLDMNLTVTCVLYHQFERHHWNAEGAEFRDLHRFVGMPWPTLRSSRTNSRRVPGRSAACATSE